mgnify:CR=1 FL=1
MKLRLVTLLGLLFLIKNTFAQQEFKKINLDSLVLVTPIVDAAKMGDGNANTFDAALSSKISQELFESLKYQLPGVRCKSIRDLETLPQREYIDITHNYLAWTKSKKIKGFVDAPPVLVQNDVEFTLHIAVSGYYGPSAYNGIYANLFIIDNKLRKIIYCDRLSKAFTEITDQQAVCKLVLKLVEKYVTFKPNQR